MKKIAPSILSANFLVLAKEVKAVTEAGADYIHVDVMDGHFVPNITIGPMIVGQVRGATNLPLDVHLMISSPERYIEDFAKSGSDIITVHQEACSHIHSCVQMIKNLGKRAGVAINPATPVDLLDDILEDLDMAVIMSVNPGFGGQKFIKGALKKIRRLRRMIDDAGLKVEIEVDGGVKLDNIEEIAACGADVFVAGSAVFGGVDYEKIIKEMRGKIGS